MTQDAYSVNIDGERVSPSTEALQRELIMEFGKNSKRSTNDIKYQVLTLAPGVVGTPEVSHGCNSVHYWTALSDCYVGNADSQPVLLVASKDYDRPINSVTNLRFVSAAGGNVYIESFN